MSPLSGPHPAVATVRAAVRAELAALREELGVAGHGGTHAVGAAARPLVLVACSGGADSLALACALAFVAPRAGFRAGALTVDHGVQAGSDARAEDLAARLAAAGLDPVEVLTVTVGGPGGPEAAARDARYTALAAAAGRLGAAAVLIGHTLDDQAETVLLGLARGSGTRSLAGMAARRGLFRRPLLAISRALTRQACAAVGVPVWDDPHNDDTRFTRVRVRSRVLPVLEAELGPGIAAALARTATAARADADALDDLAVALAARARVEPGADHGGPAWDCAVLSTAPTALRRRVLRAAALDAGCPASDVTAAHVDAVETLLTGWHGQSGIDLPGAVTARRIHGRLVFGARTPR